MIVVMLSASCTVREVVSAQEVQIQARSESDSWIDKWRLGLGLGLDYHYFEAKLKDDFSQISKHLKSTRSQTKKNFSISPSLEIGATLKKDYYFGTLVSWHYLNTNAESRAPLIEHDRLLHDFQMDYFLDLLLKPGIKIVPNFMVYGLIGPTILKWSHKTSQFRNDVLVKEFKIRQTNVGLGAGLGFEYNIKESCSLSVNYVFHIHKSAKNSGFTSVPKALPPPFNQIIIDGPVSKKVEPSYSTIGLRFTYFL